jgi:predicted N-acetyltransferase YhbS
MTTPEGVAIRAAQPADAAAIARLSDMLRAHLGDPEGVLDAAAVLRDCFGDAPEFDAFVAELQGVVVGSALFNECYEPAYAARGLYLMDLCVDPSARRRGVGRALMARLVEEARIRDRSYVLWMANPGNDTARKFYAAIQPDREVTTQVRVILVQTQGQS